MVCAQAKNNNPFSVLGVSRKHVSKRFRRELNRQSTDDPAGAQLDETLLRSDTRSMFSCDETFVSLDRWFVSFKFIREICSINCATHSTSDRRMIVRSIFWWREKSVLRRKVLIMKYIRDNMKDLSKVILFSWVTI